jgi:hypothetical protein
LVSAGEPPTVDWATFVDEAPDLADAVTPLLQRTAHHVLATLRRDGSPRVSGTEVQFVGRELVAGCPAASAMARDVQRDGRFALHTNPGAPTMDGGDAKLAGVAELHTAGALVDALISSLRDAADHPAPPDGVALLRFGLTQITHTAIHPDGDRLVIRTWHPGRAVESVERA